MTQYEAYDLFAVTGILFNHESPRRGFEFVTRKISSFVALVASGRAERLKLGNLEAKRERDMRNSMSTPCGECYRPILLSTSSLQPASAIV